MWPWLSALVSILNLFNQMVMPNHTQQYLLQQQYEMQQNYNAPHQQGYKHPTAQQYQQNGGYYYWNTHPVGSKLTKAKYEWTLKAYIYRFTVNKICVQQSYATTITTKSVLKYSSTRKFRPLTGVSKYMVSIGFGTAMRTGSSSQSERYPTTTYIRV